MLVSSLTNGINRIVDMCSFYVPVKLWAYQLFKYVNLFMLCRYAILLIFVIKHGDSKRAFWTQCDMYTPLSMPL